MARLVIAGVDAADLLIDAQGAAPVEAREIDIPHLVEDLERPGAAERAPPGEAQRGGGGGGRGRHVARPASPLPARRWDGRPRRGRRCGSWPGSPWPFPGRPAFRRPATPSPGGGSPTGRAASSLA